MLKCLKFCPGIEFKADFHSKISVCRHELGVEPPPRQFQPCKLVSNVHSAADEYRMGFTAANNMLSKCAVSYIRPTRLDCCLPGRSRKQRTNNWNDTSLLSGSRRRRPARRTNCLAPSSNHGRPAAFCLRNGNGLMSRGCANQRRSSAFFCRQNKWGSRADPRKQITRRQAAVSVTRQRAV